MLSLFSEDYTPSPGQLCQVFKGCDKVYPVTKGTDSLVPDPLIAGDLLVITKVNYHDELSSYYIEFMREKRLFYSYFYEQIFCFMTDEIDDELLKLEKPHTTFDYPWVLCD